MENNSTPARAKRVEWADEGIIAAQYTLKGWFVKVKPVFSLDGKNSFAAGKPSVLFSFVEKGKKGSGFDVYVDMDVFDLWADDVLDVTHTFKKTIEAEKAAGKQYPETYKYVAGKNGEKSVGFCPSTANGAFATVNGVTVKDGKRVYANVPVDYNWLRTTMKWYRRVTAPYFAMVAETTRKNMVSNWRKSEDKDTASARPTNVAQNPPQNIQSASNQALNVARAEIPVTQENPPRNAYENAKKYNVEVSTSTLLLSYGQDGKYAFKAFTHNNREHIFIVPANITGEGWETFKAKALIETEVHTNLVCVQGPENRFIVTKIA